MLKPCTLGRDSLCTLKNREAVDEISTTYENKESKQGYHFICEQGWDIHSQNFAQEITLGQIQHVNNCLAELSMYDALKYGKGSF